LVVKEEVFTLFHHDADEVALSSNVDLGRLSTETGVFLQGGTNEAFSEDLADATIPVAGKAPAPANSGSNPGPCTICCILLTIAVTFSQNQGSGVTKEQSSFQSWW
jgi:hypothetical protein